MGTVKERVLDALAMASSVATALVDPSTWRKERVVVDTHRLLADLDASMSARVECPAPDITPEDLDAWAADCPHVQHGSDARLNRNNEAQGGQG